MFREDIWIFFAKTFWKLNRLWVRCSTFITWFPLKTTVSCLFQNLFDSSLGFWFFWIFHSGWTIILRTHFNNFTIAITFGTLLESNLQRSKLSNDPTKFRVLRNIRENIAAAPRWCCGRSREIFQVSRGPMSCRTVLGRVETGSGDSMNMKGKGLCKVEFTHFFHYWNSFQPKLSIYMLTWFIRILIFIPIFRFTPTQLAGLGFDARKFTILGAFWSPHWSPKSWDLGSAWKQHGIY